MPQSIPKGLTREHVLKAMADLDSGIEHPFGRPTKFELVHDGKRYAPKAVVGIAFRHLTGDILHHREFSGGEAPGQANYELRRLGFVVESRASDNQDDAAGGVWSDAEVRLLLADYFEMLQLEICGEDYNKAERNRELRRQLTDRSRPSVEFKHRNVSAVLLKLGLPYIDGYKPARNYQRSLSDSVQAYLDSNRGMFGILERLAEASPERLPSFQSLDKLFEAPPEETLLPDETPQPWRSHQGRKVDFAQREAGNRRLGRLGEEFTLEIERRRLLSHGRDDLAKRVEWVSDTIGDGLGFDVLSFDEVDDSDRLIEVKTTQQGKYFPFYVTSNEVRCSEAMAGSYHLYRLFGFARRPRLYVLHGSLAELCQLVPISYRATVARKQTDSNE